LLAVGAPFRFQSALDTLQSIKNTGLIVKVLTVKGLTGHRAASAAAYYVGLRKNVLGGAA